MIKLRRKRSLGWALTQNDWCPNKKGRFAHSQTSHVKAVPVKPQGKKLPEAGREAHNTPFLSIFGRSMEPLPPSSWSWTFGLQQWDNTFLFWPSFESWEYSIYLLCVKKKRPWCWAKLKAGGEGDDRGWDGWMASLTRWTWVWVPGMLQSMGLQRVGHDWASWLADRTYNCYMILLIKNN